MRDLTPPDDRTFNEEHPAARGIMHGLALSAPVWLLVAVALWWWLLGGGR